MRGYDDEAARDYAATHQAAEPRPPGAAVKAAVAVSAVALAVAAWKWAL